MKGEESVAERLRNEVGRFGIFHAVECKHIHAWRKLSQRRNNLSPPHPNNKTEWPEQWQGSSRNINERGNLYFIISPCFKESIYNSLSNDKADVLFS